MEADGSHSCEINPTLFPTEEVCRGDLSHGIWCQEHSCEAPAPPAPTSAPTAAPLGAPTMAPSAAPAADVPTPAAVVGNDPIFKAHLFLGLTILLLFPFTRLVHMLSAPIRYVWRPGYQVVRTRRRPAGPVTPPAAARPGAGQPGITR